MWQTAFCSPTPTDSELRQKKKKKKEKRKRQCSFSEQSLSVFSSSSAPKRWSDRWCWGLRVLPRCLCEEKKKFKARKLHPDLFLCCLYNTGIVSRWRIISPDPLQVLPFVYSHVLYLCMAVRFSLLMCVISAQQECWKAAVLFRCFHWKGSNINSTENAKALTGSIFIYLFFPQGRVLEGGTKKSSSGLQHWFNVMMFGKLEHRNAQ